MWAYAKAKDKAEITSVAAEDRDKVESEAAERARAWAQSKAKYKAEIARLSANANENTEAKSKAEVRATEKSYAAKISAE